MPVHEVGDMSPSRLGFAGLRFLPCLERLSVRTDGAIHGPQMQRMLEVRT